MKLSSLDLVAFIGYFVLVGAVALAASRKERDSTDYFLAGRRLSWWLIGISLIASNISTEHFVGMAGSGVDFGLAIASYEWMAAITLVIVARWFLPVFLSLGVTTMPEYLEARFDHRARSWLAVYMLLAYVFVAMATVLYSGGVALETLFDLPLGWGIVILATFAGAYTAYGGLKAVVWTDLIQGWMLLLGGALVTWLSLSELGGWDVLLAEAGDKFHTVLPLDHPELPWFAVFFGGLWIANVFYWGCNQFITQRTLGARDLRQGQYGVLFAAYLKLLIPFVIVVPGIAASVLYAGELSRSDMAYPFLIRRLVPEGLSGVLFAALIAAIMSSLDSMLNATATIFTVDIYGRRLRPASTESQRVAVGRASTVVFLLIAAFWAPFLQSFERVFSYIQEFWGLITPGVAVVFLAGLFWRRASPSGAAWALAATLPVTVGIKLLAPGSAFLDQMWLAGLVLVGVLVGRSLRDPAPVAPRGNPVIPGSVRDRAFDLLCLGVIGATVALYALFF